MSFRLAKRSLLGAVPGVVPGVVPGLVPVVDGARPEAVGAKQEARAAKPVLASPVVRVGAVNTPDYSGLLEELIGAFSRETGYEVRVTSGEDVYDHARRGEHDLLISHYGKEEVEPFVSEGLGQWPRTVFANVQALIGPAADPAGVRGMDDAIAAFAKVAASGAPYVVNAQPGLSYLEAVLWHGAGRPEKGGWYRDAGLRGEQAIVEAARVGGYVLWGAFPFLRSRQQRPVDLGVLDLLVTNDSLLQRIMVTVVVSPAAFPDTNTEGAVAFQQYLLSAAVQGRIRGLRLAGQDAALWWPAARHNNPMVLPA